MPEIIGTALLIACKFLAYAGYFLWLNKRFAAQRNGWALAGIRLALGIAIGALIWGVPAIVGSGHGGRGDFLPVYFGLLAVGRLLAWALVIFPAFHQQRHAGTVSLACVGGVALSHLIEIPLALGLITAIGGIC